MSGALLLQPGDLARLDESPDTDFYSSARFVHHFDDAFRFRLTSLYASYLKQGRVLDLCSSFDSHLPPHDQVPLVEVVGHGMNEAELAANLRLSRYFVRNLKADPSLRELGTGEFDVVLCAAGIQYLTKPVEVLREVARVLKPGGVLIVSFSSHCFQEKAIAAWLARPGVQRRVELVQAFLTAAGFSVVSTVAHSNESEGSLGDRFAAVVGVRPQNLAEQQGVDVKRMAASGIPPALWTDFSSTSDAGGVDQRTLERWIAAYEQMGDDAQAMGIPASAIPPLPTNPTAAQVRSARDHLAGMIASFLSSGL